MVRIVTVDAARTVATGPAAARRPLDSPIGAGLSALGAAQRRREDTADRSAAVQQVAELRTELTGLSSEIERAAPEDGAGVAAAVGAAVAAGVERRRAGLSDRAGRYFAERAALLGEDFAARAEGFEIAARGDADAAALGRAIDATANAIRSDPTQYEAGRADLLGALEGAEATLPPAAIADLRRAIEAGTATAALRGAIDDDPDAALDALHSGDYDARLSPGAKDTLIGQAERERDRRLREAAAAASAARADYLGGFADYEAFLRAGNAPDGRYSDAEVQARVAGAPDAERAAAEVIERRRRAEAFGAKAAAIASATPGELAAMMAELTAAAATPEDFRAEAEELRVFLAAVKERDRRIAADPAGYAIASNPAVADAWAAADAAAADAAAGAADPEAVAAARQAAVAAGIAEQRRLGVPASAAAALPEPAVALLAEQYRNSGGQARALLAAAWQAEYGRHFPAAARQLADAGLPGTLPVLASMTRRAQAPVAATLAELMQFDTAALRAPLGDKTAGDVDKAVTAALAGFTASMATPSQIPTANRFAEEVSRLAYNYARQGVSAADAGRLAASQIVTDSYVFQETNGRAWRVPVDLDAEFIAEGAERFLENLALRGPFNVPAADPVMDPAEVTRIFAERLAAEGYWVTNGDETGLVLFHEFGFAVQDAAGDFIVLDWETLRRGGEVRLEEFRRGMETLGGRLFGGRP